MTDAPAVFPLLVFSAEDTAMALAAEEVRAIQPANPSAPYIGALLGRASRRSLSQQRSLWLEHGATVFQVVVDGPVMVEQCQRGQIVPIAPGIRRGDWQPVIGFARLRDALVALLDAHSLIAALTEMRRGGSP